VISITDGQIFLETELFYKARWAPNSSTLTGEKVESPVVFGQELEMKGSKLKPQLVAAESGHPTCRECWPVSEPFLGCVSSSVGLQGN